MINQNWNCPTIFNTNNLNRHKSLFEKIIKEGMKNIALVDDGTLHHIFLTSEFAKQYKDLKIFIGSKFRFRIGANVVVLALYPRNNKGLEMLKQLSTEYVTNDKKELRLEGRKKTLSMMNIVVDASSEEVDEKNVREVLRTLFSITSKGFVHAGLADGFTQKNKTRNMKIKDVLKKEGVGFIPFHQVLFLEEDDYDNLCSLFQFKEQSPPEDIDNMFVSDEDVEDIFDYMEGVPNNSEKMFNNTNVDVTIGKKDIKIPSYEIKDNFQVHQLFKTRFEEFIKKESKEEIKSAAYLFHLVMEGIVTRYGKNKVAFERALYELKVIIEKNFSNYFLIVWDFMKYAKHNGIPTGPGRGSVVGSIVAYALDITEIDPIKWNLQFERFLNVYRLDYPDIDIDVSQRNRDKLIKYLKNKYGEEFVAQIVTISNYGFKKVINYMIKQMRVPKEKIEQLKDMKLEQFETYSDMLENLDEEGLGFVKGSKDVRVLLQNAYALRDIPQGTSRHASGVLISSVPLKDEMPMMYDENGLLTQVPNDNDTHSLEKMGFLKFDILGLRNLDIIEDAKMLVEMKEGKPFAEIPYNDEKTLNILKEGATEGVFQLESASHFAKIIGIDDFKDIVALNALNRPGPKDNIPLFAERKGKPVKVFGKDKKELLGVDSLYPILKETNGVIVYQEQINEIVREWAGYSIGEAELFREAISKKRMEILKKQRSEFIQRAIEKGREEKTTIQLYELILLFANYGFNKSHAVAYADISYTCAYFKAHYPAEYMASLMNSVANNSKKVSPYVKESRRMNVDVLRPDINESTYRFIVTDKGIRAALQMINHIGEKTAKTIIRVRGNKPFTNLKDLLARTDKTDISKSNIETLIRAGALDSLGERGLLLQQLKGFKLEEKMGLAEKIKEEIRLCDTIFSVDSLLKEKLIAKVKEMNNGITGVLTSITITKDKYEREMAKVQLLDFEGKVHYLVIFYRVWKEVKTDIFEGALVIGEVDERAISKLKTIKI